VGERRKRSGLPKAVEPEDSLRFELQTIEAALRRIPDPQARYAIAMMIDILSVSLSGERKGNA
jgi:hypothetical protein